ncbi:PhzF family phenazine biosynthesis protein [uncultured Sunxiuqinia sp.]|uniref:PhzF family phenazine biosynthesis protein n=1 Tax=uncultured Sunxiuqinia sp. TaxID=1573825 RepID=UPI002AA655FA|nr:PhzF family phenazine biosynthesis protein [uncultured Sunxiuqinia sp.]
MEQVNPNFGTLSETEARGIIITAPGKEADFVSRFFAPGVGIDEDPVTGSAHTTLAPYWADRLDKNELSAKQISERGGKLQCILKGNRVLIAGKARTYLQGKIFA